MKRVFILSALIFIGFSVNSFNAFAQNEDKKLISGNSVNFIIPQGKLADTYDFGYGIYGNIEYNFGKHLAATFDLGWNSLTGPDTSYVDDSGIIWTDSPNMSVWEFSLGLRASISVFYLEARGGYFTGIKEWGFVPAVGVRLGRFDIQGNYTMAGDNEWIGVRVGFYWGR